ncbi:MAG: tRNA-dihydrouridine synthase [Candidatus Dojkabacteria bacterium]|nr:MAG: tRNA-dihydrouridine synthase [Candidatus Dojkabacteria bacterium]
MVFSWKNLDYPVVLCPPMDGITDNAFRELIASFGGSSVLYCEFVNVKGLIYQNSKTLFELRYTENQRPIIAQLFGNDPNDFFNAAQIIVKLGFDGIDINMGCPAHKVASKGSGCALMNKTDIAREIVRASIEGAKIAAKELKLAHDFEVSCKMRLGVDDKNKVLEHGIAMIEAGAKAIAIHGRTLKQMYSGHADWDVIRTFVQLKQHKYGDKVPVFGSGDVKSLYDAFVRILTTGVDGVMIGRGSFGKPWIFDRSKVDLLRYYVHLVEQKLDKKSGYITLEEIEQLDNINEIKLALENPSMSFDDIKSIVIRHARLMYDEKGDTGILQMRKHLGWYFHGFEGAKSLRSRLVRVKTLEEVENALDSYSSNLQDE